MPRFTPIPDEPEAAERAAVSALVFLADRPDDLARFLSISGIEASAIRRSAAEPGFLAGVLDFVLADEALLVAFAAEAGFRPESLARLREALDGGLRHEVAP
jgi:hypothetical protein